MYRDRRRFWCRVRPWLAGGEIIFAVWPDLTPAHWAEPTHTGRSERGGANRTWTAIDYLAELIGWSGSVGYLRITIRNIGLGSARPMPG